MDSVHYFLTLFFLKINIVCNISRSLEGGPGADPRDTGEIVSLGLPWYASVSPQISWRRWLVWVFLLSLLPCDLFADKLMKMDGQVWTIDADGSHCRYKKLYGFRQGQVFIASQLCQSMPGRAKA